MRRTFFQIFKGHKFIVSLLCLPLLASCGDDEAEIAAAQDAALVGNKIDCALNGADVFSKLCATERVVSEGSTVLMIRHMDGGFKRFRILTDGRGLESAEGFNDTRIEIIDEDYILLSSGNDKYKLKAQFKAGANLSEGTPLEESFLEGSPQETNPENVVRDNIPDNEVGPVGTPGVPYQVPQ